MINIPKETIFFPDPSDAKKKAFYYTFFICIVQILSSQPEDIPFIIVAMGLVLFFLIYIALYIGIKMRLKIAREELKNLQELMKNPNYIPIRVKVIKVNYYSKISALANGRYQRKAIDSSGKRYVTFFNGRLHEDFDAELYQVKSGIPFHSSSFVIPILKN